MHKPFCFLFLSPWLECVCLDLSPEGKAVYLWSLTSYPPRTAGLPPYIPCPTCKKPSLVPFVREMSVDHVVVLWLWSFHTSSTLDVFCVEWIFDIGHLLTVYFRVRLWSAGVKLHSVRVSDIQPLSLFFWCYMLIHPCNVFCSGRLMQGKSQSSFSVTYKNMKKSPSLQSLDDLSIDSYMMEDCDTYSLLERGMILELKVTTRWHYCNIHWGVCYTFVDVFCIQHRFVNHK